METDTFIAIAQLAHLTELQICVLHTDFDDFDETRIVIKQISNLRILKLTRIYLHGLDPGANFCRFFSRVYPNLEELTVRFAEDRKYNMEPYLGQFVNLRKSDIGLYYPEH